MIDAIKIDVENRTVTMIKVENAFTGPGGMYEHIKTDTIEHGTYFDNGDVLLVDENGLFAPEPIIFGLHGASFVGNALIVGIDGSEYTDVRSKLETIKSIVNF